MSSPAGFEGVRRSEAVRVWLLGGFRVSVGSRIITQDAWRLKKSAALIKLLALAPGHRMHREQAMDLLWPDSGRRAASSNLRSTLHFARRILASDPSEGSRFLGSEGDSLVLCPKGDLWVDVDAFEAAALSAQRIREPGAHEAAIELYSGELLPEDRYEEWAEEHRQRLRETHLSLLLGLARLHEERREYEPAIEVLRRVLLEEPAREEAHAGLMRLHALSGSKGEALAHYERLEEVLLKELGTDPSASSRALREEITAGRFPPKESPAPGSPPEEPSDATKHNLPAPRTSFVGREREMIEVKRTLAMTRLLTLTGAGGSGKTRLALEVARDLIGLYPEGVWLVELAELSEGDLIPQAVAATLRVPERPDQALTDTLVEALRDKVLLLIMDNCEHLGGAAAQLVDTLLDYCQHLEVLATSREPLTVRGEALWQVRPLTLPAMGHDQSDGGSTINSHMRSEALRLFVDRARLRLPSFELTRENAGTVARVCRKLEGIPLAIELATARMGALAVDQVAQRLDVSLDVLSGANRTAAPRQQTLRATIDWSHNLLSEDEQKIFRRFSAFAGGWTLEAAETVCSGGGVEEGDILDLLGGLVDKSLVVAGATTGGAVRYRMLEPIRQYAREELEESGHGQTTHRRHAKFFLTLAEEAQSRLWGAEEAAWLSRLEVEHDNLREALSWALGGGDPACGLQLAAVLSWFWSLRGHFSEGARWLKEALKKCGVAPYARAEALSGLGHILAGQNDFERAETCFKDALALYKELGNREGVAECLGFLGWVAHNRLDTARAKVLYQDSLAAVRESGNRTIEPNVLKGLASIVFESGDVERAQGLWEEALTLARERRNISAISSILIDMGEAEFARGNHAQATLFLEEALTLGQQSENQQIVALCLSSLGIVATKQGEPHRAKILLKESLFIDLKLQSTVAIAEDLEGLAEVAGALGQDQQATRLWGAATALREKRGRLWSPMERLMHEPLLAAARSRMEEAVWETAFAEGKAMNLQEAVEYAASEDDAATPTSQARDLLVDHIQQPALTRREQEVTALVARGFTNRNIGTELSISEHTAATHVGKIMRKLGVSSRSQLAAWVTEHQGPPH